MLCFLWFSMVCAFLLGVPGFFVFNLTYECIYRNSSVVGNTLGICCLQSNIGSFKM